MEKNLLLSLSVGALWFCLSHAQRYYDQLPQDKLQIEHWIIIKRYLRFIKLSFFILGLIAAAFVFLISFHIV